MSTQDSAAPLEAARQDGFAPGSQVGNYRLVALLASGGMAHVWTAEPATGSGLGRTVALKVIRPELAQDLDYARMFIDEATIATAVHHPNVCETFELDRHENVLYMAMEWVPGDSLGGLLRQGRRFAPLEAGLAVRICADACAGLHAAHEAVDEDGHHLSVVHRDVSPPNILVSLQGQVKVNDFGIAKARYQLHERTRTGEVKGKFGYLAPEQIAGGSTDRRIDIYSMGCVLYVATTGLRPFGNGAEAMTKILRGEFKHPREIDPMYPPGLEEIIVKALQHKPDDRFASADEMRLALEQWLVDARRIVTPADVARCVKERMAPASYQAVIDLQKRRRGRTGHSYQTLLEGLEDIEPPTAASGLVVPPDDLQEKSASMGPSRPEELSDAVDEPADHTVRERFEPAVAPPNAASEDDHSGWHKTGEHELREMVTQTERRSQIGREPRVAREAGAHSHSVLTLLVAVGLGLALAAALWWLAR